MTSRQEAVKNAAEMLDREMPGWHNLIDVNKLKMASCEACVLGQAFGPQVEDKVRAILGERSPDYNKPSTWCQGKNGYHYGVSFLKDNNLFSVEPVWAFGMSGDCEWKSEILDRQLKDEQSSTLNQPQTETQNGTDQQA